MPKKTQVQLFHHSRAYKIIYNLCILLIYGLAHKVKKDGSRECAMRESKNKEEDIRNAFKMRIEMPALSGSPVA